jgi:hypothetical protein
MYPARQRSNADPPSPPPFPRRSAAARVGAAVHRGARGGALRRQAIARGAQRAAPTAVLYPRHPVPLEQRVRLDVRAAAPGGPSSAQLHPPTAAASSTGPRSPGSRAADAGAPAPQPAARQPTTTASTPGTTCSARPWAQGATATAVPAVIHRRARGLQPHPASGVQRRQPDRLWAGAWTAGGCRSGGGAGPGHQHADGSDHMHRSSASGRAGAPAGAIAPLKHQHHPALLQAAKQRQQCR